ncbi:MAG: hypothetical protein COB98_02240 [Flavobacteriaceae bacterium]|nr:MAG: hypothetical protein COB98_02240 [Flavobacteriaceae bacterium]
MNPFILKFKKISLYKIILLFIIVALIGNLLSYKRSYDLDMIYASVTQTIMILLGLVTLVVKKNTKPENLVSIIVVLMILYGGAGMVFYGFSASCKFLLFLGPLFFAEYVSFKKNIVFFISGLGVYILLAVLIINGVIRIPIDHNLYAGKINAWMIDGVSLLVISYTGFLIKISSKEMKQTYLKELEKSDDRFQQIFNNSNEAIVLLKDFVMYDCNKKMLELFDCEKDFILNKHVFLVGSHSYKNVLLNDSLLEVILEETQHERVRIFEWEFKKASGEKIVLEVSLIKVEKLDDGAYTQAILRDITLRKNKELAQLRYQKLLEEQVQYRTEELVKLNGVLLKANAELENQHHELTNTVKDLNNAKNHLVQSEKMASIGVLTAGVAHEINNPLNFIQSGIYSFENILENGHLMGSPEELRKIQRKVLDQMNEGVYRVTNIVKGLNRFSRENKTNSERCDLNEVIKNCLLILNHESKDTCKVMTNFCKENPVVLANEGKLHQVFINVIHNAIQSIDTKGEIEVTTKTNLITNKIIVTVRDNGCGIEADNLKKVFDPFYTTKRAEKGTGLGLSIVYGIIREQQAEVEVTSVLGKGTTISFIFTKEQKLLNV